jgi:hypothetical protein
MLNSEIVTKLFELEKRVSDLEAGKIHDAIAEVSLSGACKLMGRGASFIKKIIKSGLLPAAKEPIYKHTKTGKKKLTHYRIRVKDIREYQEKRIVETKRRDREPAENVTDTFKQIINEFHKEKPLTKSK